MAKEEHRIESVDPTSKEAKNAAIDHSHFDMFKVEGDPEMEYYWARSTNPTQPGSVEWESMHRKFETCNDPKIKAIGRRPDGTYQVGDAILMQRSKAVAEKERKEIEDAERRRMRKIEDELQHAARRAGVRIYKSD
jgi:hypothetical protein